MDANEYALKVTPADKSLGIALRKAEWMGKGQSPSVSVRLPLVCSSEMTKEPAAESPTTTTHAAEPVEPSVPAAQEVVTVTEPPAGSTKPPVVTPGPERSWRPIGDWPWDHWHRRAIEPE